MFIESPQPVMRRIYEGKGYLSEPFLIYHDTAEPAVRIAVVVKLWK
jgi:hypothetical protein